MISAGGMKVAYGGIFRRKANGALVFLGKRQGSERNASTKSKKTTLASGEPRSVVNRETRSPCLMNDT
jgi:hypothetical protein